MIRAVTLVTLVTLFVCFLYANPLKHDKSLVTSSKALKKVAFFDKRVFKYTINDYLKNPLKNDFLLSPKGKYLSYFQMKKDGKYLALYDINKNKDEILLKEEGELIRGYVWANDPRVNILESDQMVRALRKKGLFVPYMVKYDEGHGFHKVANNIELYNVMLGFFYKCFNTKK